MYCGIGVENLERLGIINAETRNNVIEILVKEYKDKFYHDTEKYGDVRLKDLRGLVSILREELQKIKMKHLLCISGVGDLETIIFNKVYDGILQPLMEGNEKFREIIEAHPILHDDEYYEENAIIDYAIGSSITKERDNWGGFVYTEVQLYMADANEIRENIKRELAMYYLDNKVLH